MDNQQYGKLFSFIWNIANDVLVHAFEKGDYKKIILPFTVLRRIDVLLEETKMQVAAKKAFCDQNKLPYEAFLPQVTGYPFYNTSAFTMSTLKNEIDPQRLKMNVLEYFNGFSPDVQDVIDKFQLRHWVDALTNKGRLGSILEKFTDTSINLSIKPIKDDEHHRELRAGHRHRGEGTRKIKERVIWPRYHQLDAVRRLLAQTAANPVGRKFLIQHSAGSGKSNTITWLAYQLVLLQKADTTAKFDSIIVVTDRVNLDKQIRDNINAFAKLKNLVGWADRSDTLRELLQGGKKIIVSTIHKFSFILDEIGSSLETKNFAIVIDEAHSSQNGEMASSLAASVSGNAQTLNEDGEPEDTEDKIHRIIKGRKLAKSANYYAFTATPKNKTLEMFGEEHATAEGLAYAPFHEYTMKQAIEEKFILDVVRN